LDCHAGIIHVVFIITLFLQLYLFILSIYFISDVGCWLVGFMVFNATFSYIIAIWLEAVLLVEET